MEAYSSSGNLGRCISDIQLRQWPQNPTNIILIDHRELYLITPSLKIKTLAIFNGGSLLTLSFLLIALNQLYSLYMQDKQKAQQPSLINLIDPDPQRRIVSLPLQFQFLPVEMLSKEFTKLNNNHSYRIHYLGARPHNTLALHKKYAYNDKNQMQYCSQAQNVVSQRYKVDYRRIVESYLVQEKLKGNNFYKSGLFYRAFEGMNPYLGTGQWIFNSLFQSGNLDCAIKVQQNEFDLFLKVDANTKGHVQWFYFSVKNGSRKQNLKMNLCNLSKGKTLYDLGLQLYVFSKRSNQKDGTTWTQSGVNLGIQKKQLRYEYLYDKVSDSYLNYYCLELSYDFQYQDDEVFFAYCIPFTFSRLLKQIKTLSPQWVKQGILGKSLSGIDIPLLHITNHQFQKEKKNIIVTGRWHPGESNSSHMLQGFMNFLTGTSREAAELRNRVNFFIVPMANPDGVICGNSRTSLAGKDLNRQFIHAKKQLYPQVTLVKDLAKRLQQRFGMFMYLDFHGHSRKKNTFFYGPSYAIHQPNYYKSRIFPKLVEKVDSNFRFYSCSFTIDEDKKSTARAVMLEQIRVAFSFTIQTSIGSFYDCQEKKIKQFSEHEWRTIGTSIAQGLSKFIVGFEQHEELMRERRLSRLRKRPPTASKHIFTQQPNIQEDEISSYFKQGNPLKLGYQEKSIFGSMIDQLKITKKNNYIKDIDQECDSDAHDEDEEFEASKMKQFNNLVTDAARKDPYKDKSPPKITNQPVKIYKQLNKFSQEQQLAEELRFFQELEEQSRKLAPPPLPTKRPFSRQMSLAPKTAGQSKRIYQTRARVSVSQVANKSLQETSNKALNKKPMEKKMFSESQFANEKLSYFGQFRIFVDKEKPQEKKQKSFHRNSIFSRERSKNSRRLMPQDTRFMSESYFQKAEYSPYEHMQTYIHPPNPPKSTNFEFKFDDIDTTMVTKQKLKDYLRGKINKANRSSTIGPASFYGVRQNINQKKISNKQKFIIKQESPRKDSIKVIKFT